MVYCGLKRRSCRCCTAVMLMVLPMFAGCAALGSRAWKNESEAGYRRLVTRHYTKTEHRIPMRDGAKLFTSVYAPKDRSRPYPILMLRTPYSVKPYGEKAFPKKLGPSRLFAKEKYIFVYQDVRGRFMSEGEFRNMTPHIDSTGAFATNESTDTFDTIEWLLTNVPNHNGNVGMWGISYPGFYAAAGMIDAHPALKAVSPQAPIADWFYDDFHHHGAFFLPHAFNFFAVFGTPRPELTKEWGERFDQGTPDGYAFFLNLGPLTNVNERHFKNEIAFWNKASKHPNYDSFWSKRNILPHLNKVSPAVMTVGGWFDAEDLYGPLKIYRSVERRNPDGFNILVMGPWAHGGWARMDGDRLGAIRFGSMTSRFYQEKIELPFFNHFLKGKGTMDLPEAYVFETGRNIWHRMDAWPPPSLKRKSLYARAEGMLSFDAPQDDDPAYDEYVSDPHKPVPYTESIVIGMTKQYMTDDQRFASRRPDVVTYRTGPLDEDVTLVGPITADLWVSTSGTASDWIVKVIDVLPPDTPEPDEATNKSGAAFTRPLGGYQAMVRSEVIRGRFRNSYTKPEPFVPNEPTNVRFELLDLFHTFRAGHEIMLQVQSTWFPLVDRNPQTYVDNIFEAVEADFQLTTQRVHRSRKHATRLEIGMLVRDFDADDIEKTVRAGTDGGAVAPR